MSYTQDDDSVRENSKVGKGGRRVTGLGRVARNVLTGKMTFE